MVKGIAGKFWVLFFLIVALFLLILFVVHGVSVGILFQSKIIAVALLAVSTSLFLHDFVTGKYESYDALSKKDVVSFCNYLASILFFGWYAYL